MDESAPVQFQPFGAVHAGMLLALAGFVLLLIRVGRVFHEHGRLRTLDRALAAFAGVGFIIINAWQIRPGKLNIETALPLHVCDVVVLLIPFVLLYPKRWLRALLYYWGLGLSTQGILTPGVQEGPGELGFWLYWLNHLLAVGIPIYDLAVRDYRPAWKDYWIATALALVYVALMLPFDVIFSVNYGYVGPATEQHPSLLDVLGPWPWRLGVMIAMGLGLFALMTLPWVRRTRRHPQRA